MTSEIDNRCRFCLEEIPSRGKVRISQTLIELHFNITKVPMLFQGLPQFCCASCVNDMKMVDETTKGFTEKAVTLMEEFLSVKFHPQASSTQKIQSPTPAASSSNTVKTAQDVRAEREFQALKIIGKPRARMRRSINSIPMKAKEKIKAKEKVTEKVKSSKISSKVLVVKLRDIAENPMMNPSMTPQDLAAHLAYVKAKENNSKATTGGSEIFSQTISPIKSEGRSIEITSKAETSAETKIWRDQNVPEKPIKKRAPNVG